MHLYLHFGSVKKKQEKKLQWATVKEVCCVCFTVVKLEMSPHGMNLNVHLFFTG